MCIANLAFAGLKGGGSEKQEVCKRWRKDFWTSIRGENQKRMEVTMMKKSGLIGVIVLLVLFTMIISVSLTGVAIAAPKEKTTISIVAGRPGDAWYVLSHALSVFINERSPWLKAEVQAAAGMTDNTRMVMSKPEKYSNHLVCTMTPGQTVWGEGKYLPLKIGSMLHSASAWVTLNPKLKTLADLKGKTVTLQRKGRFDYVWIFVDLLEQAGVWDSVKPMHGGIGAGLTALLPTAHRSGRGRTWP
jgi:TRAP-type uncharacterized transport system substrate-binding protein